MDTKLKNSKGVLKYWTEAYKCDQFNKDILDHSICLPSLQEVLSNLAKKDWKQNKEGFAQISKCAKYDARVFNENSPHILNAILYHIDHPSVVTRQAVYSLRDMVITSEDFPDEEWERIFSTLLIYYSTASNSMRDVVEHILKCIIDKIPFQKTASVLTAVNNKLRHKKPKELVAKLLKFVVVELGPQNVLDEKKKNMGSDIVKTTIGLLTVPSDTTRYYGRKIIFILMMSQAFEKFLHKHLPPNLRQIAENTVNDIKSKGVGQKFKNVGAIKVYERTRH